MASAFHKILGLIENLRNKMPGLMCLGLDELGGTFSGCLVKILSFANYKVSDLRSNYLLLQLA